MVGANHWIRSIETYTFLRWLTLVSASYASSNSGHAFFVYVTHNIDQHDSSTYMLASLAVSLVVQGL